MLGNGGESGAIGSGILVTAISDQVWRVRIVLYWLGSVVHLQGLSCGVDVVERRFSLL